MSHLGGSIAIGGRTVGRLGFGAMRITGAGVWGDPPDRAAAVALLRCAADLGVTFVDTADAYGPGVSEELIKEALHDGHGYGDVLVATKGGLTRPGPDRWEALGRPEHLRQAVQLSLRRLGLEQLPLWQLHRIDPGTPRDDTFGAIRGMVDEGLIGAVGLSQVDLEEIAAAQAAGLEVASVQNYYNVGHRTSEPVLDWCTQHGVAFVPWLPIEAGRLSGAVDDVARARSATPAQVALAWLLQRSPVVVPIPGTSSVAHLEENVRSADLVLTPAEVDLLT